MPQVQGTCSSPAIETSGSFQKGQALMMMLLCIYIYFLCHFMKKKRRRRRKRERERFKKIKNYCCGGGGGGATAAACCRCHRFCVPAQGLNTGEIRVPICDLKSSSTATVRTACRRFASAELSFQTLINSISTHRAFGKHGGWINDIRLVLLET